jgi:glyoxylase-like metal-dependent hydrolase (beta-lactamase superfamily II)
LSEISVQVIKKGALNIHVVSSPLEGELVNSIILESANKLMMIDAPLLRPYSKAMRAYADQLGKPIDRILITHSHPDHWAGLEHFEDQEIYALAETKKQIEEMGDWLLSYHQQIHGELVTDRKVVPKHLVEAGALEVDGIEYNLMKIVNSEINYMLVIDIPKYKTIIAQDLIYNKVYLFLGEKTTSGELCFDSWVSQLEHIKMGGYDLVIPGHGEPDDASVIDRNIEYIQSEKALFESAESGELFLGSMMAKYPEYRIPNFLYMTNYFLFPAAPEAPTE